MSIQVISVGGVNFDVYGDITELDAYVVGTVFPTGVTFTSDFTRKGQLLVTSSRLFERLTWQGARFDITTPQPLAWPRVDLNDRDGVALDGSTTPDDIFDGFFELVIALDQDGMLDIITMPSNVGNANTRKQSLLNRVEGAVTQRTETEYFVPMSVGRNNGLRLPLATHEFIKPFLGNSVVVTGIVSGTDGESSFDEDSEHFEWVAPGL